MTLPDTHPAHACPNCTKFHRRAQVAEAALEAVEPERLERAGRSGGSIARTLLSWSATKSREERDEALTVAHDLAEALYETAVLGGDPHDAAWEALERYRELRGRVG